MAQESGDTDVVLLTITHPSWTEAVRLSTHETQWLRNDPDTGTPLYGTVSNGHEFLYCPIQASMPNSTAEQAPEGRLVISNVTREVSPYLKMVDKEYPKVTVQVVNSGTPDVVEMEFPSLSLENATWDASQVEVTLKNDIASMEPSPWLRFSLAYFPNMVS
jgi:hypothetical protein